MATRRIRYQHRRLTPGPGNRPRLLEELVLGCADIPFEVVERSVENSMVFGVYGGTEQVGFARVVTDRATFAYLADVFVLETHRGRGVGKWLMETILSHPELHGLRRWMLATRDAHELYRRHGFDSLERPEIFMERNNAL